MNKKLAALAAVTLSTAVVGVGAITNANAATPATAKPAAATASTVQAGQKFATRSFDIKAGKGAVKGTVTFTNRSVVVSGTLIGSAAKPTRMMVTVWSGANRSGMQTALGEVSTSVNQSTPFTYTIPANVRGGAGSIDIDVFSGQDVNGVKDFSPRK